jgi:hypothetical protein
MLSDDEISNAQDAAFIQLNAAGYSGGMGGQTWDLASARAIEAALLKKLAGVGVEPVAWLDKHDAPPTAYTPDELMGGPTDGLTPLFSVTQLAAARVQDQADAEVLREFNLGLGAENQRLRQALRFYAAGEHFNLSDPSEWDTVSGEPQNFWCDSFGTATVEDGAIAGMALQGAEIDWEDEPPPLCTGEPEEIAARTQVQAK